jgi:hypothetical protein
MGVLAQSYYAAYDSRMKERLSLSVEQPTATYLAERAARETNGNVSALVDRLARQAQLTEALSAEARWYAENPSYADDAESERHTA